MLVLSRHVGERVFLEVPNVGRVEVLVVRAMGDSIRLGITAPPEILIVREELAERFDGDVPRDSEA